MHSFSSILLFVRFKLISESCTTSGVCLESYQTSMMYLLIVALSQKCPIIDILQGSKYGSATSFLNIFPLSLFGHLNEYISVLFLFWKCGVTLLMWRNQKYYKIFHWFPNQFLLYIDHRNTKFSYIYRDRDAKKLTLKNFKMKCKADRYH